jgi:hypothetical protein
LRKTVGLLLAAAVLVGVASVAQAGGAPPTRHGKILGEVLSQPIAHSGAGGSLGAGNLKYHGGPVEHTNLTYAIYWVPSGFSVSGDYESVTNRFFTDVAADSGKTSNVYYSDTQYSDGSGKISYSSSFGGSYVDTNPLPASGCSDSVTSVCLTDAQIQAEVQRDVAAAGWTPSLTTEFFVFTAKGIGSCLDSSHCAFSYYCAYHSSFGSGSSTYLYANMPYADTDPSACDAGQHPNNSDADATLNVTSHEHNETITDELGNAWYDSAGYENGDKCAWKFGTQLGSTAYGQYNQLINGHPYELQMEYSNAHRACVLTGT